MPSDVQLAILYLALPVIVWRSPNRSDRLGVAALISGFIIIDLLLMSGIGTLSWPVVANGALLILAIWGVSLLGVRIAHVGSSESHAQRQLRRALCELESQKHALDEHAIVSITNLQGDIIYVNDRFCASSGYTREELVGANHRIVCSGEHSQDFYADLWHTILRGDVWRGEIRNCAKDGHLYWVEATIVPFKDESGAITQYVAIRSDITERKRAEEALRHSQKMEAVGTLARGVAHDFSNLLTIIFGFADVAMHALPQNHEACRALEKVRVAAVQGRAISSSLMTFGRAQATIKTPTNLCRIVSETMSLLDHALPSSIVITQDLPTEPVWVEADASQLQQILINLIDNAGDAMLNGGRLRITLREDSSTSSVRLVISDTGFGMTEERLSHVFEPYFTTKSPDRGTGLGLSIVHSIVADHEGEIVVTSEPGEGTSFTITLPTCAAPASAHDSCENADVASRGEVVLLAEDNDLVRSIMRSTLQSAGYEVVTARDGLEATLAFDANRASIALAILDVDLRKGSGLDCLSHIRKGRPDLPALMVSGRVDCDDSELNSPHAAVLRKPFQASDLLAAVKKVLSTIREGSAAA